MISTIPFTTFYPIERNQLDMTLGWTVFDTIRYDTMPCHAMPLVCSPYAVFSEKGVLPSGNKKRQETCRGKPRRIFIVYRGQKVPLNGPRDFSAKTKINTGGIKSNRTNSRFSFPPGLSANLPQETHCRMAKTMALAAWTDVKIGDGNSQSRRVTSLNRH